MYLYCQYVKYTIRAEVPRIVQPWAPLGLELSPGKTSIYLGPAVTDEVVRVALQPTIDLVGACVCGEGVVACKGHRVLGSPIGSAQFVFDFVKN